MITDATGLGSVSVALLMVVFGLGGVTAGRTVAQILTRHSLTRVLRVALAAMALLLAALAVLTAAHRSGPVPAVLSAALVLCWGAS